MADEQNQVSVDINLETTPIYYTDNVSINANEDGVVFDFIQRVGNTNRAKVVTRVGMSRVHAKKFASELGRLLAITEEGKKEGKN